MFLTLLVVIPVCQAAKILLVPGSVTSHCHEAGGVGHALLDRGHSVFILFYSKFNHRNCFDMGRNRSRRIEPIFATESPEVSSQGGTLKELNKAIVGNTEFSFWSHLKLVKNFSRIPCSNMFYDKEMLHRLTKENIDLAIIDTVPFTYCLFLLPVKLGIPYVGISSGFEEFVTGNPLVASINPHHLSRYTDEMSFLERLGNALNFISVNLLGRFSQSMDVLNKIDPELTRQDLINLAAKCELYLHNYDPILSYPVPMMPNHVMIGGITAMPANPLPSTLDTFYKEASGDIILVTFGGTVGSLSNNTKQSLRRVFRRLKVPVVLQNDEEGVDKNIKSLKFVPQNDLLGNPKTKVFVSHCGNNGVFEALYHGVPLVCTPIFADQFYNGARVQKWGAGKTLPLLTSSEEDLYEAIHAVLTDSTFRRNMKRASEMYHSQPMAAGERAAFWIEYVLKYGGGHLRSKASEMSTFVYMGYDILCFVVFLLGCVMILLVKCCHFACRICRKKSEKVKTN